TGCRAGPSPCQESRARRDHQRARARVGHESPDHHQVDDQQPGGSDVHYGIVHYGTDPKDLSQTAKNPIRLNQGHAYTTFRVRLYDLKLRTTYFYTVTSEESNGTRDG